MSIKKYRERARMSQETLGKLVGLTRSGVCRHERGTRFVGEEEALRYANALGVEVSALCLKTA